MTGSEKKLLSQARAEGSLLLLQNHIVNSQWRWQVCEHAVSVRVGKKKKSTTKESSKDDGGWRCLHVHDVLLAFGCLVLNP